MIISLKNPEEEGFTYMNNRAKRRLTAKFERLEEKRKQRDFEEEQKRRVQRILQLEKKLETLGIDLAADGKDYASQTELTEEQIKSFINQSVVR